MKALTVVASAASGAGSCAPTRAPMRAKQAADFRAVLRALADDTRLRIVSLLAGSATPVCVCDIEARFELSQPTISHHLKILRKAGLVRAEHREIEGAFHDTLLLSADVGRAIGNWINAS